MLGGAVVKTDCDTTRTYSRYQPKQLSIPLHATAVPKQETPGTNSVYYSQILLKEQMLQQHCILLQLPLKQMGLMYVNI